MPILNNPDVLILNALHATVTKTIMDVLAQGASICQYRLEEPTESTISLEAEEVWSGLLTQPNCSVLYPVNLNLQCTHPDDIKKLQLLFKIRLSTNVMSTIQTLTSDSSALDIANKFIDKVHTSINIGDFIECLRKKVIEFSNNTKLVKETFTCPSHCTNTSNDKECILDFGTFHNSYIESCLSANQNVQNAITTASSEMMIRNKKRSIMSLHRMVIIIVIVLGLILYKRMKY